MKRLDKMRFLLRVTDSLGTEDTDTVDLTLLPAEEPAEEGGGEGEGT